MRSRVGYRLFAHSPVAACPSVVVVSHVWLVLAKARRFVVHDVSSLAELDHGTGGGAAAASNLKSSC